AIVGWAKAHANTEWRCARSRAPCPPHVRSEEDGGHGARDRRAKRKVLQAPLPTLRKTNYRGGSGAARPTGRRPAAGGPTGVVAAEAVAGAGLTAEAVAAGVAAGGAAGAAIWSRASLASRSMSACAGSTRPQPVWSSRPLRPSVLALEVRISCTVATSIDGLCSIKNAATPLP